MSLTGVVLGTVLSEEGVAAVADSILAVPSIYTSDTATDCAWIYSGMRCEGYNTIKTCYTLTVAVGVGHCIYVCTGGNEARLVLTNMCQRHALQVACAYTCLTLCDTRQTAFTRTMMPTHSLGSRCVQSDPVNGGLHRHTLVPFM